MKSKSKSNKAAFYMKRIVKARGVICNVSVIGRSTSPWMPGMYRWTMSPDPTTAHLCTSVAFPHYNTLGTR